MARVTRRKFLKSSGTGVLAVKASGMAGILAAGKAPAYAQTTTVHWLKWNDFVPAGDQILRQSMLAEAEKALGFKINMETIGLNDLQPRATAAIQAQGGADIIMIFDNKAQLYADSCADVSAVCEAIGSAQGGYYDLSKANTHDGKKWIAVPYCIVGAMVAYRKSWFDEIGVTKFPETWDEYREAGKKLKAKGRPLGQTLGHTVGDAPAFAYPYLWSWGGREVEEDGKTVKLNSKETIESVKFLTAFWKDAPWLTQGREDEFVRILLLPLEASFFAIDPQAQIVFVSGSHLAAPKAALHPLCKTQHDLHVVIETPAGTILASEGERSPFFIVTLEGELRVTRIYDRQRQKLGVTSIRPWDLDRDDAYPPSRPPLHPFTSIDDLVNKTEAIFRHGGVVAQQACRHQHRAGALHVERASHPGRHRRGQD
jgi:hypothetical protein